MLNPRSLLDFFTGHVRRQEGSNAGTSSGSDTESSVPSVCFDDCNNAAMEAQFVGRSASLCTPNSNFMNLYTHCISCIQENINTNDTASGLPAGDTVPLLNQFIEYCDSLGNDTDIPEINSLLASWSALSQTQSALQESLASLGYNLTSSTVTISSTDIDRTTTTSPPPTSTLPSTASATDRDSQAETGSESSSSPDTKVIVPAVVVPIVVLLIAAVVAAWAFMDRRNKRRKAREELLDDGGETKAQLHADSFRPELEAIVTTKKGTDSSNEGEIAELPAREPVGSEMPADGRDT
ncbi:hypothetical protein BDW59DRAFT_35739 [Aspergillus cavernicola]|uniref:Mid2 domain-containing protein n=1 Tax=Aspergillus cavernicola TaxID=176166 RepID=A0ABR4INS2_9EURO